MIIKYFEQYSNKSKIYLAGGWGKFRHIVMNDTNADWLNPETMTKGTDWFELETNAIKECDGMIAWFEKDNPSGFGMTFEMGMAFALNKPYLLINESSKIYEFGMQSEGSEKTFTCWEDALKYINDTNWLNIKK
jgi:nucleoside 2-deoxyribosyltransferase